jgi:cytochrome c2
MLLIISLLVAQAAPAQDLVFKNHGVQVKTLTSDELKALVPPHEQTVYEPHESRDATYKVVDFAKVLDAVYGKAWRSAEEMVFTCLDGYRPSIPVARLKEHTTFLAFERTGQKDFTLEDRLVANHPVVKVGPYYLIWENIKDAAIHDDGTSDWPFQLTTIDLANFSDMFGSSAPPKGASENVKRGFLTFRRSCMNCHAINGQGSNKAPELNYPLNVTEYFKESRLKQWITDPASVRYGAQMPKLGLKSEKIDDIIAYLKSMSAHKQPPK